MVKPILGQEAICPDGLGRVVDVREHAGEVTNIKVRTYVNDRGCDWAASNVELIDPRPGGERAGREPPRVVSPGRPCWEGVFMSQAEQDVLRERRRQFSTGVGGKAFDAQHDNLHDPGQLSGAGAAYALNAACILYPHNGTFVEDPTQTGWTWDVDCWTPTTPRRDLVKAAALLLAEIDRGDRNGWPE